MVNEFLCKLFVILIQFSRSANDPACQNLYYMDIGIFRMEYFDGLVDACNMKWNGLKVF